MSIDVNKQLENLATRYSLDNVCFRYKDNLNISKITLENFNLIAEGLINDALDRHHPDDIAINFLTLVVAAHELYKSCHRTHLVKCETCEKDLIEDEAKPVIMDCSTGTLHYQCVECNEKSIARGNE